MSVTNKSGAADQFKPGTFLGAPQSKALLVLAVSYGYLQQAGRKKR